MKNRSRGFQPAQRAPVLLRGGEAETLNTVWSGIPKALPVGYDGSARYSAGVFSTP